MPPVLIFGARRGVGLELAKLLRQDDTRVVALVRPGGDAKPLESLGVEIVPGDAFSPADVERAFDALGDGSFVVSTMGGRIVDGISVDHLGNVNAIGAAEERRVQRFVLVTSIGCGEMGPFMSDRAREAFGDIVAEKTRAEERLRRSSLPFTILRPGGLRSEPATGRGILSTDPDMHGFIHRADLAALIARALRDPSTEGGVYAAVDAALARCANPIIPVPLAPLR